MNENVVTLLEQRAAETPDRTALVDLATGDKRSYGELAERVARVACSLRNRGLQDGDRVALLMQNSFHYVDAFLGILAAGLVAVPLNTRLTQRDFEHLLTDSQASAVMASDTFKDDLETNPNVDTSVITIEQLEEMANTSVPADYGVSVRSRASTDLCTLMYTSGTTGLPKAVMLDHKSWHEVTKTALELLKFDSDTTMLHSAPLTHGGGFMLFPTIQVGGVNLIASSFDPAQVAQDIIDGTVNSMFLVPSMIRMLLDAMPSGTQDRIPTGFRWIYYAGSPIDSGTMNEATTVFGGRLYQSFAQMEAPMFLTFLDAASHLLAAGGREDIAKSAGRPIPGREVKIVDADGNSVPAGTVGEVVAQAPQLMMGYWNRESATEETIGSGWLRTGDLGYFDESGLLFVVDRVKDMIVTGGSNVYASEVESALRGIEGIEDAAVVGIPHRVWGEQVTAALIVPQGTEIDLSRVDAVCKQSLASYKCPKDYFVVDKFPMNGSGKVLKRELRKSIAELASSASNAS